jgi:hypothetical protein
MKNSNRFLFCCDCFDDVVVFAPNFEALTSKNRYFYRFLTGLEQA